MKKRIACAGEKCRRKYSSSFKIFKEKARVLARPPARSDGERTHRTHPHAENAYTKIAEERIHEPCHHNW